MFKTQKTQQKSGEDVRYNPLYCVQMTNLMRKNEKSHAISALIVHTSLHNVPHSHALG
jgi:hypothetical protein